jgi:hypothetical protein
MVLVNAGRPWTVWMPAIEDATIAAVEQKPLKSLLDVA